MRALLGAVVGLVVATALVAALGSALRLYSYVAILFSGLAAGLVMRQIASGGGSAYAKGALAALATAVAAVGGPLVLTEWHKAQGAAIPKPSAKVAAAATGAGGSEEGVVDAAEAAVEDMLEVPDNLTIPGAYSSRSLNQSPDTANMVCMALGCLLAYQLGKGASVAPVSGAEEPETDPKTPDEAPAEEAEGEG